jgi:hypothetical protein
MNPPTMNPMANTTPWNSGRCFEEAFRVAIRTAGP